MAGKNTAAKIKPINSAMKGKIAEMESKFKSFDKTGEGFVACDKLADLMKSLGMKPNQDKLNDVIYEQGLIHLSEFRFSDFLSVIDKIEDSDFDNFDDTYADVNFADFSSASEGESDVAEEDCPYCDETVYEYKGVNHYKHCPNRPRHRFWR